MTRSSRATGKRQRKRSTRSVASHRHVSGEEYRVGPGQPPKEFQFKPGQSGNPKGARRKSSSIAPDLKALLETALSTKLTQSPGEKRRMISKAAAGIEHLVNQFAEGDRHARRDLIHLADKLGADLVAGQGQMIEQALEADVTAHDEALLADYVRRHRDDHGDDEE